MGSSSTRLHIARHQLDSGRYSKVDLGVPVSISTNLNNENSSMKNSVYDVAIVGAGPGGLSAAARAAQRGLPHILLEASDKHADTIQRYQRGKHIMAEPCVLPLRSDIEFDAGNRETILDDWEVGIEQAGVNIRYRAKVESVSGQKGDFQITLRCGETIHCKYLVLSLGVQGNPRKLGVAGEDLPVVQNTLESADAYENETIVIVGAGDAAIENAISLARRNRAIIVNRKEDFARAKDGNINRVLGAIETGQVECFYRTIVNRIEQHTPDSAIPAQIILKTPDAEVTVDCNRIITRLGAVPQRQFVESIGVRFTSDDSDATPGLSTQLESSVPGLYIVGALAGYPLIKQAMNQGYEVIEYILGNHVKPADYPIIEKKLKGFSVGKDVDDLLALIQQRVRLFRDISALSLRELILESQLLFPKEDSEIYTKGEYSSTFFNILQGEVHADTGQNQPFNLEEGQFFGEMSLLSGRPRSTTVVAGRFCILLETPRRAMVKLMRIEKSVRKGINVVSIIRTLKLFLAPQAPTTIVRAVAKYTQIQRFAAGETLFREGDRAERLYFVRSGSVTVSRNRDGNEVVAAYVSAGNYVGIMGLLGKNHHLATARTTVATEAFSIDKGSFNILLASVPKLREQLQDLAKQRLTQFTRMQAQPESGEILSFMMSHGVGEATDVLVIDESLCVGCDNCEKACSATHQGISRLDRKAGASFYSLHIPTSCRHCEQPHCMKDCPPDAIHRMVNGEVYIDDTCIGCGNCEENCPYDVIQMAKVSPRRSLLETLLRKKPIDVATTAVKCDMCKDLKGGSACVNACPTGAAIRIHAEQVVEIANKRASSEN